MRRPAIITTPYPTPEETARLYGVPQRRAKEIIKMVEDSLRKKGLLGSSNGKGSLTQGNGTNGSAERSHSLKVKANGSKTKKGKSRTESRRKLARAKTKTSR